MASTASCTIPQASCVADCIVRWPASIAARSTRSLTSPSMRSTAWRATASWRSERVRRPARQGLRRPLYAEPNGAEGISEIMGDDREHLVAELHGARAFGDGRSEHEPGRGDERHEELQLQQAPRERLVNEGSHSEGGAGDRHERHHERRGRRAAQTEAQRGPDERREKDVRLEKQTRPRDCRRHGEEVRARAEDRGSERERLHEAPWASTIAERLVPRQQERAHDEVPERVPSHQARPVSTTSAGLTTCAADRLATPIVAPRTVLSIAAETMRVRASCSRSMNCRRGAAARTRRRPLLACCRWRCRRRRAGRARSRR